jgi:uncharacterized protein (TIGR00369 family)
MSAERLPFDATPINRLLGLELRSAGPGSATVSLPAREEVTQEYAVVHGGVLAAVADTAAVYALLPMLADGERMTSVEFKVNCLGAALPDRGDVVAQSSIVRKGRTIAVVHVDVRQGEQIVLTGLFTYIIFSGTA